MEKWPYHKLVTKEDVQDTTRSYVSRSPAYSLIAASPFSQMLKPRIRCPISNPISKNTVSNIQPRVSQMLKPSQTKKCTALSKFNPIQFPCNAHVPVCTLLRWPTESSWKMATILARGKHDITAARASCSNCSLSVSASRHLPGHVKWMIVAIGEKQISCCSFSIPSDTSMSLQGTSLMVLSGTIGKIRLTIEIGRSGVCCSSLPTLSNSSKSSQGTSPRVFFGTIVTGLTIAIGGKTQSCCFFSFLSASSELHSTFFRTVLCVVSEDWGTHVTIAI